MRLTVKKRPMQPAQYLADGKPVSEAFWQRAYKAQAKRLRKAAQRSRHKKRANTIPGGFLPGNWPMRSGALSVHPKQIAQAHERARKLGVPTEFHPSGDPIFTSPGHRKAYMTNVERGVFDRDGGYGDAQHGGSQHGSRG